MIIELAAQSSMAIIPVLLPVLALSQISSQALLHMLCESATFSSSLLFLICSITIPTTLHQDSQLTTSNSQTAKNAALHLPPLPPLCLRFSPPRDYMSHGNVWGSQDSVNKAVAAIDPVCKTLAAKKYQANYSFSSWVNATNPKTGDASSYMFWITNFSRQAITITEQVCGDTMKPLVSTCKSGGHVGDATSRPPTGTIFR